MILDGKKLRDELLVQYKEKIKEEKLNITLAIILVGNNEASKLYIKNKEKYCTEVGIKVDKYLLDEDTSEEVLINLIKDLNEDEKVTGIILQSPVPDGIDFDKCSGMILPSKDVDGFTKDNVYNLYLNKKSILPCTVKGIIKLLEYYNIEINGKNVAIIGRGNIVGKPLAMALENRNATVSLLHSKTKDLKMFTKDADIVVVACGIPKLLKKEMIKEGSVVIDVGISRVDGKIVGDIDFDNIKDIALFVTPNPGGIGPMTIAMIIDNLIEMGEVNE
ncbi:bifunctional protein FolD [Firmicutes bacterium CAG:460]|jgi:methylenetetrahydrofolate dehydrogenase (NADP+)/methenyltetrahydrofolate cyclohydrolase|uniref:bifunctional 5,10-methylenetetrahydrofolate dehydrogenase/5,10-methenyltetrahydrofolate cyclohydrolase n=1 Tax=Candidatus Onthocola sp. TaxID=3085646 RepID=UPI00033A7B90|nr:bifunctional protein FolD [Firmicutes bacterium CAG:460]